MLPVFADPHSPLAERGQILIGVKAFSWEICHQKQDQQMLLLGQRPQLKEEKLV